MKELKEFSSEEEYVPRSIQYIVVHCSATRANIPFTEEQLLKCHLQRGFKYIGYHFYITRDGDSRTILDGSGAEKLLGMGDMLFMPVGAPKPTRIQGTFVRDEEISRVLDFIKQSGTVQYDEAMIEAMEKHAIQDGKKGSGGADSDEDPDTDPMFKQAVEVVIDAGQASTSLLQRRCKLGYARAARIMDEMEQKGIIGPYEGAKPRAVLISRQQWLEMQMNQPDET